MCHSLKRFALISFLWLAGAQVIFGFALLGPVNEAYQEGPLGQNIGYNLPPTASSFANEGNGVDVGAPKNFGQGYRYNLTNLYYAYDASFAKYFGTLGMGAADQAFVIFNSLSNISSYSSNLAEWPYDSRRVNHAAANLSLLDVKSATMSLLIEQLGLAQPDRYVWALHDRDTQGFTCPNYAYIVDQRNFDPVTQIYSPFVNNTLYGYYIAELCTLSPNPYAPLEADAIEYTTDPTTAYSAVASQSLQFGQFFLGFTRDDIGGLRYLYAATNVYNESAESNSFQLFTNTSPDQLQLLVTSNLASFSQAALTNSGTNLEALYPGLVVLSDSNFFGLSITTNYTLTISTPPNAPAGFGIATYVVTYSTNVVPYYSHTYANLEVLHYFTNGFITTQTITFGPAPNAPAGTFTFLTNTTTVQTAFTNGDFYILPTNLCAPYSIVQTLLATNANVTNLVVSATNTIGSITNINGAFVQLITYSTNYVYSVYAVQCVSNSTALRQGVEKINFTRVSVDANNNLATPITNSYNLTAVINGKAVTQTFQRVIRRPDILFTIGDLTAGPAGATAISSDARTTPNWDTNALPPGQPGPGTIQPGIVFTFNTVGPVYINAGPFFISGNISYFADANSAFIFQWGSFDGSTNAPVLYPSTLSLQQVEASVYFQITTGLLPPASLHVNTAGNPYYYQLQATGGNPQLGTSPYTWSLDAGSAALPNGLTLSSTGLITGVPTTAGTYEFDVQATDAASVTTESVLFIIVNP